MTATLYPHIHAWGTALGALPYYTDQRVTEAVRDDAPTDAVYRADWADLSDHDRDHATAAETAGAATIVRDEATNPQHVWYRLAHITPDLRDRITRAATLLTTRHHQHFDEIRLFDTATRIAHRTLFQALVDGHGLIADATVTSNQAPLIIDGTLADGRVFRFRARNGTATLALADVGQDDEPDACRASCSGTLSVEDVAETRALICTLLAEHARRACPR